MSSPPNAIYLELRYTAALFCISRSLGQGSSGDFRGFAKLLDRACPFGVLYSEALQAITGASAADPASAVDES